MSRSKERQDLIDRIDHYVKQRWPDLSAKERSIQAKVLLGLLDSNATGFDTADIRSFINSIIAFAFDYQMDATTSNELGEQAEQLRLLAEGVADYMGGPHEEALKAGFVLGMGWQQFQFDISPDAEALRKKRGSNTGVKKALAVKSARYQARDEQIMGAAKKALLKNPRAATKRVVDDLLKVFNGGDTTIQEKDVSQEVMYRLVLAARRRLKDGG